jgi:hypothetical protein
MGTACWDTNMDGVNDPAEDVNLDTFFDTLDCTGPQGVPGVPGPQGPMGLDGFHCWDTNMNRINDATEDINTDLSYDTLDCQGAPGAVGPAGPQGPSGIIASGWSDGFGPIPGAVTQFLAPTVRVTVVAGQRVYVDSNRAFGSTAVGGGFGLDLFVCYQQVAGALTTWGGGAFDVAVPQGTRVVMGLSAVLTGLASGDYDVGLCGSDGGSGTWDWNEWGYTSALVFQP